MVNPEDYIKIPVRDDKAGEKCPTVRFTDKILRDENLSDQAKLSFLYKFLCWRTHQAQIFLERAEDAEEKLYKRKTSGSTTSDDIAIAYLDNWVKTAISDSKDIVLPLSSAKLSVTYAEQIKLPLISIDQDLRENQPGYLFTYKDINFFVLEIIPTTINVDIKTKE